MERQPYVSPLRSAVSWSMEVAAGRAITVGGVAIIAQVPESRAAAFLSIMVTSEALLVVEQGFRAGPQWPAWLARPYRGRPTKGGSPAAARMDELRRVVCRNLAVCRKRLGISQRELAHRAGVRQDLVQRAERRFAVPPTCALILLAEALGKTVDELVKHDAYLAGAR